MWAPGCFQAAHEALLWHGGVGAVITEFIDQRLRTGLPCLLEKLLDSCDRMRHSCGACKRRAGCPGLDQVLINCVIVDGAFDSDWRGDAFKSC